jgi:hypothetical protein
MNTMNNISSNSFISKENDKTILVVLNNNYRLEQSKIEFYNSIIQQTVGKIAHIINQREFKHYVLDKIEYIIILSLGDLLTKQYIIENITNMKYNDIMVMKPNNFYYIGENQVYYVKINNYTVYLESGIIFKKGILPKEHEFINNINNELILKYYKNENEILNNILYDYSVTENIMLKRICKEINVTDIIQIINNSKIKNGYITFLDKDRCDHDYMLRLQLQLTQLLIYDFDIIQFSDIDSYNIESYDKILIDANIFNTNSTKIPIETVVGNISKIKNCNNVFLLTHDLHDWSFGYSEQPKTYEYVNNVVYPCNSLTDAKIKLKHMLHNLNIKSIIAIYDCPEFDFLKENFKDTIDCFYNLHHFISTPIYNLPKVIYKENDILFYGTNDSTYYLFRNRLLNICKENFNIYIINRKSQFDPEICEYGLANHIAKSWISIACISNFSYAVRKYNEISECGSIVIGNTNTQIDNIIQDGMIRIHEDMSDEEIRTIINKYLKNKIRLIYLGFKSRKNIENYNDNNYIVNLSNILNYGIDIVYRQKEIIYKKLKKIIQKTVNNNEFSFESLNSDIVIQIDNIPDINIGCFINSKYYRNLVINDKYYIYIESNESIIYVKLLADFDIKTVFIHFFLEDSVL